MCTVADPESGILDGGAQLKGLGEKPSRVSDSLDATLRAHDIGDSTRQARPFGASRESLSRHLHSWPGE